MKEQNIISVLNRLTSKHYHVISNLWSFQQNFNVEHVKFYYIIIAFSSNVLLKIAKVIQQIYSVIPFANGY